MSYHTPAGFDQRCTMRDDRAEHQIRLTGGTNQGIFVSCTCQPRKNGSTTSDPSFVTIGPAVDADDAWAQWWAWHDSRQIQVTV